MRRRLYYLFPDAPHARSLKRELSELAIPRLELQALSETRTDLGQGVATHTEQERDRDYLIEWWLWRLNLGVFFLALFVLIGMLISGSTGYLLLPLLVVVASLFLGVLFSLRMPNAHWREFSHAVHHGEILMMVDVQPTDMQRVDQYIQRRHPEAVTGGVGWVA